MHGRLYNELQLTIALKPRTPLLIKSGDKSGMDPSKPDMEFVRTHRRGANGEVEEVLYIPGSSFRGVLRAHAERLVRSVKEDGACIISNKNCLQQKGKKESDLSGEQAYRESCFACKLFGNTGLASRLQIGDLYPGSAAPLTETRYGVAIDRITGAVAHGPFQMEIATDGTFIGIITLRNFTIGQLGLLSAALLDIADGYVALGHAKSRGLGRLSISFQDALFRFAKDPNKQLIGIGVLAHSDIKERYRLPSDNESIDIGIDETFPREGAFYVLRAREDTARAWLDKTVGIWVKQLEAGN
jgi:CRISPR-associated protein Csm3